MAGEKLATAFIEIETRTDGVGKGFDEKKRGIIGSIGGMIGAAGPLGVALAGAFAGSKVIGSLNTFADMAGELELSQARMAAAVKATGGAAGFTAEQLSEMGSAMEGRTMFDETEINAGIAKLLTYKSVTGETFTEATKLAADLAATGFGSVDSAANMLGKALENPTQGLTALTRVGVTFSEGQKEQIKNLQAQGNLLAAQELILEAVRGQVGGVAEEMAKTDAGKIKLAGDRIDDIKEKIGAAWQPVQLLALGFQEKLYGGILYVIEGLTSLISWVWEATRSVREGLIGAFVAAYQWGAILVTNWQDVFALLGHFVLLAGANYFNTMIGFWRALIPAIGEVMQGIANVIYHASTEWKSMLEQGIVEGLETIIANELERTEFAVRDLFTIEDTPFMKAQQKAIDDILANLKREREGLRGAKGDAKDAADAMSEGMKKSWGLENVAGAASGFTPMQAALGDITALGEKLQEQALKDVEAEGDAKTHDLLAMNNEIQNKQLEHLGKIAGAGDPAAEG